MKDLEGFEDKYLKPSNEKPGAKEITYGGRTTYDTDYDSKVLEVVFPDTAIGNDVAGALRAFQKEHAGTGIRIVYKIAI